MTKKEKRIVVVLLIIAILLITLGIIIKNNYEKERNNKEVYKSIKYKYDINYENNRNLINGGNGIFNSYQEYNNLMDNNKLDKKISKVSFNQYNYIYFILKDECGIAINDIEDVKINNDEVNIIFSGKRGCKCCISPQLYIIAIDKDKKINTVKTTYNF